MINSGTLTVYYNGAVAAQGVGINHTTTVYEPPLLAGDGGPADGDVTHPSVAAFVNWRFYSSYLPVANVSALATADKPSS